jgi:radical SAM-linked protein
VKRDKSHVDPLADLGSLLLSVEKPARYLGGEVGSLGREGEADLLVALSFPDLYEIGMSNNAIRILYNELNRREGVRCERVFAPAPDFEALLESKGLPLYTLEGGHPLSSVDLLGFSVGYELAATSMLAILKSGHIPLRAEDRGEGDPIVIGGGPAISNPHPFAFFLDAAFIGEGETAFCDLAGELAALKRKGAGRAELLERLAQCESIWIPQRGSKPGHPGRRAIYQGFSEADYHTANPIATLKIVQDHGTVEIMRGCPNGCRFCHAGYYYRPQRQKSFAVIDREVETLVNEGGYREITLASLSSGDYTGIEGLLDELNARYRSRGVSFQLPSLRVSTFTLPLLEKLSEVRKSGLTFAVETPVDAWQRIINKDVSFDQTVSILKEARSRGFRLAKFYFMIGLPVPGRGRGEAEAIVDFFQRLGREVQIQINVNIGTFVPKAHTPFQWSAQLTEDESSEALRFAKDALRKQRGVKVSYHTPFVSVLEGLISRGDERVGDLILGAFERGARLDAWDEHFKADIWRELISTADWNPLSILDERPMDAALPWDDISTNIPKAFFKREFEAGLSGNFTSTCADKCKHPCGDCSSQSGLVLNSTQPQVTTPEIAPVVAEKRPKDPAARLVFLFSRTGVARFYPHLSVVEAFNRAFLRSGIPSLYSQGFNPMPRFEIIQPLPIGIGARAEVGMLLLTQALGQENLTPCIDAINAVLPEGIRIGEAALYPVRLQTKLYSLGGLLWGADYAVRPLRPEDSLDALRGALEASLVAHPIPGASILPTKDSASIEEQREVLIRLPASKSKENGLSALLESITQARPYLSVFDVSRTACYSINPDSQGESAPASSPIDYFQAFDTISKK